MRRGLLLFLLAAAPATPAMAYDFAPTRPMNVQEVDPAMLADVYGAYEIRDKSGQKRCRINLLKDVGIGGSQIDVAPGCDKLFPVMGDIAAWRLLEGWTVDLVDALRKTRVRFQTPDARYVPFGDDKDIAGMYELIKVQDKPAQRKK
jgi:hypothetical protein